MSRLLKSRSRSSHTEVPSRSSARTAFAVLAVLLVALAGTACNKTASTGAPAASGEMAQAQPAAMTEAEKVERGHYLVTLGGCNDCHTPLVMGDQGPHPDMTRMLSGHPESEPITTAPVLAMPWAMAGSASATAYAGPWGISFAANLTPDENTGLGIWTEEMFIAALRSGKHMGQSRPIMPPMPWAGLAQLPDEDLSAIYAYLRSIPPVVNHVPDYMPPSAPQPAG